MRFVFVHTICGSVERQKLDHQLENVKIKLMKLVGSAVLREFQLVLIIFVLVLLDFLE